MSLPITYSAVLMRRTPPKWPPWACNCVASTFNVDIRYETTRGLRAYLHSHVGRLATTHLHVSVALPGSDCTVLAATIELHSARTRVNLMPGDGQHVHLGTYRPDKAIEVALSFLEMLPTDRNTY